MPRKEYVKKITTLLFTGKASDFGSFSAVLLNHKEMINHQITIVSSGVLAAGKYKVRFIPDDDEVLESTVDTGEVLDLTAQDSAIALFPGVIKGIHLEVDTAVTGGETISAVISSYTKVPPSELTYISTQILDSQASDHGSFAATPSQNADLFYHQLSLSCDSALAAGVYNVRLIPDVDEVLETSVDLGKTLEITGTNSAFVQFTGVLKGVYLEESTPFTAGSLISVVLSSSTERFDSLVASAIGATGDHFGLINIGTNTHVQIDSHISNTGIHFTEASIDHLNIQNIGSNSHAAIDTHLSNAPIHVDWAGASAGTIHTDNYIENVPTTLETGTVTATTYGITSDGGVDDILLAEATTLLAGLMSAAKWNEVVANTAKVTNATHTGEVTGATALSLDVTAITNQPFVGFGTIGALDEIIVSNGGVLSSTNFTEMALFWGTYFNNYVHPNHSGQVTSVADGAQVLTIAAITDQPASGALLAGDTFLTNDGGVLSETTFTQLNTYLNSYFSQVGHTHGSYTNTLILSGATVFDEVPTTDGIVQSVSTREMTLADLGGTTDHGTLTGKGDDDHTQYVLADGTRDITGNQSVDGTLYVGDNNLTVANTFYMGAVSVTEPAIFFEGTTGRISYDRTTNELRFRVNAIDRMYIDTSGNVGVGDSNPSKRFTIQESTGSFEFDPANGRFYNYDRSGGGAFQPISLEFEAVDILVGNAGTTQALNINSSGLSTFSKSVYFANDDLTTPDFFYAYAVDVTTPAIAFDSADRLTYNRATNEYSFVIGSLPQLTITADEVDLEGNDLVAAGDITSTGDFSMTGIVKNIPTTGITAFAGGGQGSATQLTAGYNQVTVIATDLDSVKLPSAVAGLECTVINEDASNTLAIFPNISDSIEGNGVNTAIVLQAGQSVKLYAWDISTWLVNSSHHFESQVYVHGITMQDENSLSCETDLGEIYISGGEGGPSGGTVHLYGPSHSTKPGYIEFEDDITDVLVWNGTDWNFQANDIQTLGDGSFGMAKFAAIYGSTGAISVKNIGAVHSYDAVTASNAAQMHFVRSRNSTDGAHTIVQDDDSLMWIAASGSDGVDYGGDSGGIGITVDGTPALNSVPGRMIFLTTAVGDTFSTERMRIDSAGNVGIGETSPDVRVHVKDDTGAYSATNIDTNALLKLENSGNTDNDAVGISFVNHATSGQLKGCAIMSERSSSTASELAFITSLASTPAERMRIDSAGKVGMLQVPQNTVYEYIPTLSVYESIGINRWVAGTGGADLNFAKSRSATIGTHAAVQSGDNIAWIVGAGSDGTDFNGETCAIGYKVDGAVSSNVVPGRMEFFTAATQWGVKRMTIDSAGDVTIENGDLIMGTAGNGIDFSITTDAAGMTSELLDDYEEGTWTPVISDGTSHNATMNIQAGTYVKVGKQVTCKFRFSMTNKDDGGGALSGNLRITGLPFTSENVADTQGSMHAGYCIQANITAGTYISGYVITNSTTVLLRNWDITGGNSALQDTEVNNTYGMMGVVHYEV